MLDGTDNFPTRYLVNDACTLLGQAVGVGVDLPVRRPGQRVLGRARARSYRDLFPEPPPPGMVPSCAEGGVLGVLCASIGSIMVTEAIKLISGIGDPLIGRLLVYDALEMTCRTAPAAQGSRPVSPITELIDYDAFCGAVTDEAAEAVAGHTLTSLQRRMAEGREPASATSC